MNGQLTTTTARMPRNLKKKKPSGKKMSPGALLSKLNRC